VSEVGKICDAYRTTDIDFTVLLTHIGFEQDKQLAAALDPAWGVDIIIGGHSHTLLSEPCEVAGIPIVQAAIGTDQIGRFDIMVDTDNNCIDSYTWQCIPITDENCPRDEAMEEVINEYRKETDEKYNRVLTRFPRAYTHPRRNMETELGGLMAEGIRESLGVDLVPLSSGGIRKPELGPIVTLMDFMEIFPFKDRMYSFKLTGAQLRRALRFMLREEAFAEGGHCEWFQFSRGFFCEYDRPTRRILSLRMNGKEIGDDELVSLAMDGYHFNSIGDFLDIQHNEIEKNGKPLEVATNVANVLQEFLSSHDHLEIDGEQRLVIHE
jgi:5'-nucleotidase